MPLKVWNGSSYLSGTDLKVWNGSSWVSAISGKVWNGSSWVEFFSSGVVSFGPQYAFAVGRAYDSGTASATVTFSVYPDGTMGYATFAEGFPDNGSYTGGDTGQTWLTGGSAGNFSLKYTFTAQTPTATKSGVGISPDTWYVINDVFDFTLSVVRSGLAGSTGGSSNITISIARTSDLGTILDSAIMGLGPEAQVSTDPNPG